MFFAGLVVAVAGITLPLSRLTKIPTPGSSQTIPEWAWGVVPEVSRSIWTGYTNTSSTRLDCNQTEPDKKIAGSSWLPGPEVCRKLKVSWPDCARQHQNFPLFTKENIIWCCLAQSGHLPLSFRQTSGPGSQTEPVIFFVWLRLAWFCLASSGYIWSWCNQSTNFIS